MSELTKKESVESEKVFLVHFPIDTKKIHDKVLEKISEMIHLVEKEYNISYKLTSEKAYLAWAEDNIFNKLTLLKEELTDYSLAQKQLKEECDNMGMVKTSCPPSVFEELIEEDDIVKYLKHRQEEPEKSMETTKEELSFKDGFVPCPNCGSIISYTFLSEKYDLSDGMLCPVCDITIISKEKSSYMETLKKEKENLQGQIDEYLTKQYPDLTSCWLLSFKLPIKQEN